jgi:hypothetical protein
MDKNKPLNLAEFNKPQEDVHANATQPTQCLLCEENVDIGKDGKLYLSHLLTVHHLLIADAEKIGDLQRYVDYWRGRLKTITLDDICFKINTNTGKEDLGLS